MVKVINFHGQCKIIFIFKGINFHSQWKMIFNSKTLKQKSNYNKIYLIIKKSKMKILPISPAEGKYKLQIFSSKN